MVIKKENSCDVIVWKSLSKIKEEDEQQEKTTLVNDYDMM